MICGGSGFIGSNLAQYLLDQGNRIVVLDRNKSRIISPHLESFEADLLKPELFDTKWFEGVNTVINLSGKDIFTFWSKRNREMIWESRVTVNRNLINFMGKLGQKPETFISASAAGFYGNKGEKEVLEDDPRGEGFLADVCEAWEAEARRAESLGMRSVQVRTAPVLLKNGGIMLQLLKSMRFGFTLVFGDGRQWFPWIHMKDLLRIYHAAVTDKILSGPVNACSPNPVRFHDFLSNLTKFQKAIILPFPVLLLKLFLQETADVVLFSQRMFPGKLMETSFQFSFSNLEDALKDIFGDGR